MIFKISNMIVGIIFIIVGITMINHNKRLNKLENKK
jgi:uncharacterized protein YoxC